LAKPAHPTSACVHHTVLAALRTSTPAPRRYIDTNQVPTKYIYIPTRYISIGYNYTYKIHLKGGAATPTMHTHTYDYEAHLHKPTRYI
jgi:hypothetical protein